MDSSNAAFDSSQAGAARGQRPLVVVPGDDPRQIGGSPHLDRLGEVAEVRLFDTRPSDDREQLARVAEAEIILNSRGHVRWPRNLLESLPRLKLIATCSIGTDSVDLQAAAERGVAVCNVPGRTASIVAEHALALTLAAARNIAFQTAEMLAGRWTRRQNLLLAGRTIGIVGTGAIGCAMARLARGIGMDVVAWSFHPDPAKADELGFRYVALDRLLAESDVVSLHVRLSPETQGLIGAAELSQMRPGALLVNTARGAVVDTAALVAALHSGHLGGAALDVFDQEPLPGDSPLLLCPNLTLTPHAADQTPEGVDRLNAGAVDNILAFLQGEPQNVVNR